MKIREIIDELEGDIAALTTSEFSLEYQASMMQTKIYDLRICVEDIEAANNNILDESDE